MIRVFVIASTPMMRVGLRTILTHGEMQVVGEAAALAEPAIALSEIDVIVVAEETLLDGLQRTVAEGKSPALLVLSNNNMRLMPMLNTLSPQGWGGCATRCYHGTTSSSRSGCCTGVESDPEYSVWIAAG